MTSNYYPLNSLFAKWIDNTLFISFHSVSHGQQCSKCLEVIHAFEET